jgi:hypothetical protein
MKNQVVLRSAFFLGIVLGVVGCQDLGSEPPMMGAAPPVPVPVTVSFANTIIPIFQTYGCYQCHGGTNNLDTHTVAGLLQGGDHGPAIVPGNADASLIILKTSSTPPFGDRMPQGGLPVPENVRNIIRDWINQGAKNN